MLTQSLKEGVSVMAVAENKALMTVKRWLIAPFVWLIKGYQRFISPLLPQSCRYYPSCSQYSLTAFRRFGVRRGLWLSVRRLVRCHPWTPGGVDHVPEISGYKEYWAHLQHEKKTYSKSAADAALRKLHKDNAS